MDTSSAALPWLNLEAKALAQPLCVDNQWSDLGDGRVEFISYVIRVIAVNNVLREPSTTESKVGDATAESGLTGPVENDAVLGAHSNNNSHSSGDVSPGEQTMSETPVTLLDDLISDDTPFVGENMCIVWNSLEKQLSFCLMFTTREGYAASWGALHALQHKSAPPLGFDLLLPFQSPGGLQQLPATPPQMSFIERHAVAASIIEFDYASKAEFWEAKGLCSWVLQLQHAELLEYFATSQERHTKLVHYLQSETTGTQLTALDEATQWEVPSLLLDVLSTTAQQQDLRSLIRVALRLHSLQHLLPLSSGEELLTVVEGLVHRINNEILCLLLTDGDVVAAMAHGLQPVAKRKSSTSSIVEEKGSKNSPAEATIESPRDRALRIAAHLHLFSSLITLAYATFPRELLPAVLAKTFSLDLLDHLNQIAEVFWGVSNVGVKGGVGVWGLAETTEDRQVLKELGALLQTVIIRLNEKGEEVALNSLARGPMVAAPEKYTSLLRFISAQLFEESGPFQSNAMLLHHLFGMHDDEGTNTDRLGDPSVNVQRSDFHAYCIDKLLTPLCRPGRAFGAGTLPVGSVTSHYVPPSLIRLLEYMLEWCCPVNRDKVASMILANDSVILPYISFLAAQATQESSVRTVRRDWLCANLRLVRSLLRVAFPQAQIPQSPCSIASSPKVTSLSWLSDLQRRLITTYDIIGTYLSIAGWNRSRGSRDGKGSSACKRRNTVRWHYPMLDSTLHSLFRAIAPVAQLSDLHSFLLWQHRAALPRWFVEAGEGLALRELRKRYVATESSPLQPSIVSTSLPPPSSPRRCVDELGGGANDWATFPARLREKVRGCFSPTEPAPASAVGQSTPPVSPPPSEGAIRISPSMPKTTKPASGGRPRSRERAAGTKPLTL